MLTKPARLDIVDIAADAVSISSKCAPLNIACAPFSAYVCGFSSVSLPVRSTQKSSSMCTKTQSSIHRSNTALCRNLLVCIHACMHAYPLARVHIQTLASARVYMQRVQVLGCGRMRVEFNCASFNLGTCVEELVRRDIPAARYRNTGSRQVSSIFLHLHGISEWNRWFQFGPGTRRVQRSASFRLAVSREDSIVHRCVCVRSWAWAYVFEVI